MATVGPYKGVCVGGPRDGAIVTCLGSTLLVPEPVRHTAFIPGDVKHGESYTAVTHRYVYDTIEIGQGKLVVGFWRLEHVSGPDAIRHVFDRYAGVK